MRTNKNPDRKHLFSYFSKNITTVVALVLIWRGIWYVLDEIDKKFFGGSGTLTALGGIIVGIALLYLPDKDLKEIEKL